MTAPGAMPAGGSDVTATALLGGRVQCLQPRRGFRAAIDPVLLAAAVPAGAGEHVLDVGCATGAAAFCLAGRVGRVSLTGLEIQDDWVQLARRGVVANGFSGRVDIVAGDLLAPPTEIAEAMFDHVMANPPYRRAGTGNVPPDPAKALATVEGPATLAHWIAFCRARVRPGGTVTVIHDAARARDLQTALTGMGGSMLPVLPRAGAPARRVLVQVRQGDGGDITRLSGFVLHEDGGAFTAAAEAVLRHGEALLLSEMS